MSLSNMREKWRNHFSVRKKDARFRRTITSSQKRIKWPKESFWTTLGWWIWITPNLLTGSSRYVSQVTRNWRTWIHISPMKSSYPPLPIWQEVVSKQGKPILRFTKSDWTSYTRYSILTLTITLKRMRWWIYWIQCGKEWRESILKHRNWTKWKMM